MAKLGTYYTFLKCSRLCHSEYGKKKLSEKIKKSDFFLLLNSTLQLNDWKSRKKIIAKTLQICTFPAKKVSINFLCFFWLQAFQKFISHYNLMIESQ